MPESNELPRGARSAVPALRGGSRIPVDQTEQYRVAYTESQRTLDDQRDELQGMRTRAVQFTAFVSAATAFLVGTGLHATNRKGAFYPLAGIASTLSVLSIISLAILLVPRNWNYRMTPKILIEDWIEQKGVQQPSDGLFLRKVALAYDEMSAENGQLLKSLRTWYICLILAGSVQVIAWATLVWFKS